MKNVRKALSLAVILLSTAVVVMAVGKIIVEFLMPGTELVTDYLNLERHGYAASSPWLPLSVLVAGGFCGVMVPLSLWKETSRPVTILASGIGTIAGVLAVVDLLGSLVSTPNGFHIPFFDWHLVTLVGLFTVHTVIRRPSIAAD